MIDARHIFHSQINLYVLFLNLFFTSYFQFTFFHLTFIPQTVVPFSQYNHLSASAHDHYQLTILSFKPNINIKSLYLFLSWSCALHIALAMDFSALVNISHIICFQAQYFTLIQNCWHYTALVNSDFLLQRKFLLMRLLATFPNLNQSTFCSGTDCILISSICAQHLT